MPIPTIQQVRTALESYLITQSTVATDVGEYGYMGTAVAYPCLRYSIRYERTQCDAVLNISVYCWSEAVSSLQASQIIDQIISALHQKVIKSGSVRIQNIFLVQSPAPVRDNRLWRGEAYFRAVANA